VLHRSTADFNVSIIGFIVGAPDKTVIVVRILASCCVRGRSGKGYIVKFSLYKIYRWEVLLHSFLSSVI